MISPLLVLNLTMEYTLYSLSSIARVGCLLRCKDEEEYSVYSIARRRGEVHSLLLLSSSRFSTQPTPCLPAYDGGRGVGHRLHHEEERRSTQCTPSCASSPPRDGVPNVLLLVLYIASRLRGVGCVLHLKEPLLLTMEYASYSCWTRMWAGTIRRAGWAGSCTTTRSCWRFSCHLICNIEVGGGDFDGYT